MASGLDFLTSEAIDGELLTDRMAAGALAPQEALHYALEIGRVLAVAHGRGLVHGRVSPDRIMIAGGGARLLKPGEGGGDEAARYRSPEQVRGEPADWRSDIFAFGVLLYEMASGKPAFSGEGADLEEEIRNESPASLMATSPAHAAMEGVIAGCLEKDPARRRQRIQNAVIELRLAAALQQAAAQGRSRRGAAPRFRPAPPMTVPQPPSFFESEQTGTTVRKEPASATGPIPISTPPRNVTLTRRVTFKRGFTWKRILTTVGLAAIALAGGSVLAVMYSRERPAAPAVKFSMAPPEHARYPGTPSVSPDGRALVFSAVGPEGQRTLWLRALDDLHARELTGTEGGFAPFWSPDSEYIAFFAHRALKKVRVRGGSPDAKAEILAPVETQPGGGSWNQEGTILFAPGMNDGLYRVSAKGGPVSSVLRLDPSKFEQGFLWPQFLPDGKHFVFFNRTAYSQSTGVYAGNLDSTREQKLLDSETNAVYSVPAGDRPAKTGYLLYMKDRDLMGQGFDPANIAVQGDPITVAEDIGAIRTLSLAPVSASGNSVLVYQSTGTSTRQLVWMNRAGEQMGAVSEGGMWGPPRISPDGSRLVVGKMGKDSVNADLWLFDPQGNASAFVQTPGVSEAFPIWSPDGSRIAFWSNPQGVNDIYVKALNGGKPELLYKDANAKYPTDWSNDGRFLLFHELNLGTRLDVWVLSLAERRAASLVGTVHAEGYPALSPDGKWLAYQSDESGMFEVYVVPFEGLDGGTKRRWKVSAGAGNVQSGLPRWRGDSRELFFMTSSGEVMSANVSGSGGQFSAEEPKILFCTRPIPNSWNLFDVSADGQRFILNLPLELTNTSAITVTTNWSDKSKR